MITFIELFTWCLVVFGVVNGVINSSLLQPLIVKLYNDTSIIAQKIGQLFWCPMCLGFWTGLLFSFLWFSPSELISGPLFGIDTPQWGFKVFDAFLGSVACWFLSGLGGAFYRVGINSGGGCSKCGKGNKEEDVE